MAGMTFLEIVQEAYAESGLQNTGPSAVTGQTGRNADFVRWVLRAHAKVQALRSHWNWDWRSGAFDLTNGNDSYNVATDFLVTEGIREFVATMGASYVYPEALGVNSRQFLKWVPWPIFRTMPIPVTPGYPTCFSVAPDGTVRYFPRPNQALKAVHEYYLEPEVMENGDDIPRMPEKLHMAIVWQAVMFYSDFNKDWTRFESAREQLDAVLEIAYSENLMEFTVGGPLA